MDNHIYNIDALSTLGNPNDPTSICLRYEKESTVCNGFDAKLFVCEMK